MLTVPYADPNFGRYAYDFSAVEYCEANNGATKEIWVTFRPQHADYARNTLEYLATHLDKRLAIPETVLKKVFKRAHLESIRSFKWHEGYQKVYRPSPHAVWHLPSQPPSYIAGISN